MCFYQSFKMFLVVYVSTLSSIIIKSIYCSNLIHSIKNPTATIPIYGILISMYHINCLLCSFLIHVLNSRPFR